MGGREVGKAGKPGTVGSGLYSRPVIAFLLGTRGAEVARGVEAEEVNTGVGWDGMKWEVETGPEQSLREATARDAGPTLLSRSVARRCN